MPRAVGVEHHHPHVGDRLARRRQQQCLAQPQRLGKMRVVGAQETAFVIGGLGGHHVIQHPILGSGDGRHEIAAYVLAGVAAAEAVALIVMFVLLKHSRREAEELRRRVDTRNMLLSGGREAVKTVWQTANIMRKDGFGAAVRSSIEDLADWAEVERPDLARLAPTAGSRSCSPTSRSRQLSTNASATGRGSG